MLRVYGCITNEHDIRLVLVAAFICLFSCYTAFTLLSRARSVAAGRTHLGWLTGAAAVTGSGVWSTHFVAMLAFRPGLPMGYDISLTATSVAIAMVVAGMGFLIADRGGVWAALGGGIVGAGIGAMHFTGMKALIVPAVKHWDPAYAHTSLVFGMAFGALALWIGHGRRDVKTRLIAGSVLALGIVLLHFTAMTAFSLQPDPTVVVPSAVIAPEWLAMVVALVTVMIVALAFTGSAVDQHLAEREKAEADRLRKYVAELEATQRQLQATTDKLQTALVAAAAASQAKSQFLAMMSHELRTPLNAIIGFSEITMKELFGPIAPRYREYLGNIADSGNHLLGLINDVLDFSKVESGQFELQEQQTEVEPLIAEALKMVRPQADTARVRLDSDVPRGLPAVMADPRRVRQVLLNLLANGIKFTPEGGEVRVTAWADEGGLCVAVRDTGIGMVDADIPNALQHFVQIDSDLNRKRGGTGLGLPLSKRLIELHGGTLEIESTPGLGTTVTVRLPDSRVLRKSA